MRFSFSIFILAFIVNFVYSEYVIYSSPQTSSEGSEGIVSSIINGVVTGTNYYPYIAQLFITKDQGKSMIFECTAELIGEQYILTAAHCVNYDNRTVIPVEMIKINVGSSYLATSSDIGNFYNVTDVYSAGFDKSTANDIVLLKLDKKVPSDVATPTKVYPYKITTNLPVEVAGFGSTFYAGPSSKVLLRALVTVSDSTNCSTFNSDWANNSGPLVCSISPSGNDSCNGDSGGPLVAKLNGKRVLVGTVSWGRNMNPNSPINCGTNNVSYYVRTAYFVKWIASVMNVDYNTLIEIVNSS
ncbi:Clotting factor B [Smittium mucronatum]|uniref:Clotting factor B n=1 Tax=Smittium mucronatum TaxID=133383 RepID=A0A1R0GWI9_9FUNG|nr:Clotting factor B [Smittium mucronatum]OLY81873.1 Clotting factor B [Smittium mucronatum]